MLIIGTKFIKWGSALTSQMMNCGTCGTVAPFVKKTGIRFITIFFVIPIFPISGKSEMMECPQCKTTYQLQPGL